MIFLQLLLQVILIFFSAQFAENIEINDNEAGVYIFFNVETEPEYIEEIALSIEKNYPNIDVEITSAEDAYLQYYDYAKTNGLYVALDVLDDQKEKKLPPSIDLFNLSDADKKDISDFLSNLGYKSQIKEISINQ
ncbi:MAG: hypothetical protein Q9M91_04845 [Candidatus Dojkabacteria bacterium]|nr:hypothetical protein [Candidatus Dojkabacteria bacterium]MDQ7021136.1 hypothetical protein [Candidatus Dojkabacteria bacterium]